MIGKASTVLLFLHPPAAVNSVSPYETQAQPLPFVSSERRNENRLGSLTVRPPFSIARRIRAPCQDKPSNRARRDH